MSVVLVRWLTSKLMCRRVNELLPVMMAVKTAACDEMMILVAELKDSVI